MHWRRKWQPTPVFLPGESQGPGSLVGCHLWGHTVRHDWSDLAAAAAVAVSSWSFLVAQLVKNLPVMWETRVWPLGWEDPLEKGKATHSSSLVWKISWTEEPSGLPSMGSQRVGHDWMTNTHTVSSYPLHSWRNWRNLSLASFLLCLKWDTDGLFSLGQEISVWLKPQMIHLDCQKVRSSHQLDDNYKMHSLWSTNPVGVLCLVAQSCPILATPWTVAHGDFSRQEYWSGLQALLQGIFPTQGSNSGLPHCRQILYHWATREAQVTMGEAGNVNPCLLKHIRNPKYEIGYVEVVSKIKQVYFCFLRLKPMA